ncbi:MAG: hypothetical protein K9G41_00370 [Flavobacteriales bacterium]|nr:hypothetical protein [Flavobacteriales bacterium]
MNLLIRIAIIVVLGAIAQTYLPWWSAVVIALLVEAFVGKADNTSFFSGFYGLTIPWMVLATYIDVRSESLLTVRILELFKLPQFSFVLIIVTGLVGGLIGGVGTLTGGWIKAAFLKTDGERN